MSAWQACACGGLSSSALYIGQALAGPLERAQRVTGLGTYAEAFAAGAVLTMLANSMMPEAFEHGGRTVGLVTVLGFLVAGALSVLQ